MRSLTATLAAIATIALAGCGGGDNTPIASPVSSSTGVSTTTTGAASTTVPGVHVSWEQHAPPITISAPVCDDTKSCLFPYRQDAIATGDVEGSTLAVGGAAAPPNAKPNTYATIMTSVFSGRFSSCGSGTAIVRRIETVDPESGAWSGRWAIVPGYGTDDLAGLTGSGEILLGTQTSETDLTSRFVGDVSCTGAIPDEPLLAVDEGTDPIRFHGSSDLPALGATVCDAAQSCLWPTSVHGTFDGDLRGTSIQTGVGRLSTDPGAPGYAATAVDLFRGTVAGCGDGTMVIRSTSELAGTKLAQRWEIVPGFGSGALAAARGSGTTTASRGADGIYAGDADGHITCG